MAGSPCKDGSWEYPEVRFTLIGLVGSSDFQQCLSIIEYLHKKLPQRFLAPFIRPMLEFDWVEYLMKAQRSYGNKLWSLESAFIVFANNKQIATVLELQDYLSQWFTTTMNKDVSKFAMKRVSEMYEKYMEHGRKFAFLSISIDNRYIGTLIIMLYHDIVPKTCRNFLRKCRSKDGYKNLTVHRIMDKSWIQCADFVLPPKSMSNENYVVPHNRRGIVSMCSNGPHSSNKTQFFITLESTPWMDYKYVAFGQIMQGEYVLQQIENVPTRYEVPLKHVEISDCGEMDVDDTGDARNIKKIKEYLFDRSCTNIIDVLDIRDAPSVMLRENYRTLKYCYYNDFCSHLPFHNLPSLMFPERSSIYRSLNICESLSGESDYLTFSAFMRLSAREQLEASASSDDFPIVEYLQTVDNRSDISSVVESYRPQDNIGNLNDFEVFGSEASIFEMDSNSEMSRTTQSLKEAGAKKSKTSRVSFVSTVKDKLEDDSTKQ